jgi:hypothetical protein
MVADVFPSPGRESDALLVFFTEVNLQRESETSSRFAFCSQFSSPHHYIESAWVRAHNGNLVLTILTLDTHQSVKMLHGLI